MANKLSVSGDVNHILVEDEETEEKTLITCGDWTKAEELDVTEYAKEVWTEELLQKFEDMQVSLAPTEYIRSRASAYDPVGDQLDMVMKDMRDGTTTHQTACEAVKAQFPKPE